MFTKKLRDFDSKHVGQRLRMAREHLGLTQKYVADSAGLTVRGYLNYEQGLRSAPAHLLNIYSMLNVNTNWLLTGEGEMFQNTEQTAASDDNEAELLDGLLGGGFSEVADAIGTLENNVPADILKDFYKVMDAFPPKLREELLLAAKQYYERNTVESLAREVEELKKELAALKAERAE